MVSREGRGRKMVSRTWQKKSPASPSPRASYKEGSERQISRSISRTKERVPGLATTTLPYCSSATFDGDRDNYRVQCVHVTIRLLLGDRIVLNRTRYNSCNMYPRRRGGVVTRANRPVSRRRRGQNTIATQWTENEQDNDAAAENNNNERRRELSRFLRRSGGSKNSAVVRSR